MERRAGQLSDSPHPARALKCIGLLALCEALETLEPATSAWVCLQKLTKARAPRLRK